VCIHADFSSLEARMDFVIHLAKQNISQQTGGPFAAAIFDMANQQLLSVGVNIVIPSHNCTNHAEMVALTLAQQSLKAHNLAAHGSFELLSSCEPCAMCAGALPWSGIKHLAYAATSEDAESIGFDEGAKHPDWIGELNHRSICVSAKINREKAIDVFQQYATTGQLY
jgi:tRNA(Arg) A34 adenosine deaminase TadA